MRAMAVTHVNPGSNRSGGARIRRAARTVFIVGAAIAFATLAACANPRATPIRIADRFVSASTMPESEWRGINQFVFVQFPPRPQEQWSVALIDLDGDGREEALVRYPCPESCELGVFRKHGEGWLLFAYMTDADLVALPDSEWPYLMLRDRFVQMRWHGGAPEYLFPDLTSQPFDVDGRFFNTRYVTDRQWEGIVSLFSLLGSSGEGVGGSDRRDYSVAYVDLDGDGRAEVFVRLEGPGQCGETCTVWIFQQKDTGWAFLDFTDSWNLALVYDPTQPYPILRDEMGEMRWNGRKYEGFCFRECV